jgi:ATP-dependent DNA helicase RecQ
MGMLRDLRKRVSKNWTTAICCFSRSFIRRHGLKYPISLNELIHIHGGRRKAKKYGAEFVELINQYVIDNEILRPRFVVKSTGIKSAIKLYIIQNVDRKLSLDDIAKAKGLTMEALLKEMEQIVYSGTKLNIKYWR